MSELDDRRHRTIALRVRLPQMLADIKEFEGLLPDMAEPGLYYEAIGLLDSVRSLFFSALERERGGSQ
jgi:hypothetical protein